MATLSQSFHRKCYVRLKCSVRLQGDSALKLSLVAPLISVSLAAIGRL